jgi:murein DD-endopeptidase
MRLQAPWLLYALLSGSLGLNLYMVLDRPSSAPEAVAATPAPAAPVVVLAAPTVPAPTQLEATAAIPAPAAPVEPSGDWTITEFSLEHSLARSFSKSVGGHGDALSAVYARMFHWDIDLRRDLYKGDRIVVAWQLVDGIPEIAAASLQSGKLGKTLTGYRWTRPGDTFAGHWHKDGSELPRRLKESPLADYAQITALLKDRPNHKGMDFKVPIGTPILATRAGVITRSNWNTAANGGCVELKFNDGTLAKYLHLSGVSVRPGQRVAAGEAIGKSGNTGRTTAPHLHYQLNRGASVVDPVALHGTTRRSINPGDLHAFEDDVARLDALLGNALARR